MNIRILGSGGWGGIPAAFCNCRVCELAKTFPDGKDVRNRPEILIETEKGKYLIEVSPDIRLQSAKYNLSGIKDFLITHDHFDHMGGLMQLNSWIKYILQEPPMLYCSTWTASKLDLKREPVPKEITILEPYVPFTLFDTKITPLPVYHESNVDKYKETDELRKEFGFLIEHNEKKFVYLGDYYKIPDEAKDLIRGADIILLDGTYFLEEKYPEKPEQLGLKDDPDHLHGEKISELAIELGGKQTVITNITHLSELPHDELQQLLPENQFIAYDGMEFTL